MLSIGILESMLLLCGRYWWTYSTGGHTVVLVDTEAGLHELVLAFSNDADAMLKLHCNTILNAFSIQMKHSGKNGTVKQMENILKLSRN